MWEAISNSICKFFLDKNASFMLQDSTWRFFNWPWVSWWDIMKSLCINCNQALNNLLKMWPTRDYRFPSKWCNTTVITIRQEFVIPKSSNSISFHYQLRYWISVSFRSSLRVSNCENKSSSSPCFHKLTKHEGMSTANPVACFRGKFSSLIHILRVTDIYSAGLLSSFLRFSETKW